MKMYNLQLMVVISILETVFTMAADLEITRKTNNGWKKERDSFKIPLSLCGEGFNCKTLNAEKINGDGCSCLCPQNYSTFIYYHKTWNCRDNEKVRTFLGGDEKKLVYFEGEDVKKELRMLKVGEKEKVVLVKKNGCYTVKAKSSSFRCDGAKPVILAGNTFRLSLENGYYFLKVSNTTSLDFITGRIIKLTINCGKEKNTMSFVLLFKYEGSFNCTKSTSTLQPIATTKPFCASSRSSPRQHATSTVAQGSSSTCQVPSTIPFTSSVVTDLSRTPSSTLPTTIAVGKASPTTLAKRPTTSDSPFKDPVVARHDPGHERVTKGKSSPMALIAGVTVAILVILIIIAVLVYRHRYSGDNSNSGKESEEKWKTAMRSLDGITLDTLDNEDHYKALTLRDSAVYESVRDGEAHIGNSRKSDHNEGHIYAPLNISEGENIYGHRNNKEIVIQDTMPKINGPISVHHRVYDLMEELVMDPLKGPVENSENGSEPVYNVLEGSCLDGPQSPAYFGITSDSTDGLHYNYIEKGNYPMSNVSEQKESSFYVATGVTEPVYNTLEAPVTENDGDPVYDVLEAPEDA